MTVFLFCLGIAFLVEAPRIAGEELILEWLMVNG